MHSLRSGFGTIAFLFFSTLHAQTLDSIPVCVDLARQSDPRTVPSPNGVIAVWRDSRAIVDDTMSTLYAQFINNSGSMEWTENGVPLFQRRVRSYRFMVAPDQKGGALVSRWDLQPFEGSNYDSVISRIAIQRVRRDGTLMFGVDGIIAEQDTSVNGYGLLPLPVMVSNAGGDLFVAWHYLENDGGNVGIAKIDSNGTLLWRLKGINPSPGFHSRPFLVDDGSGGVLMLYVAFDALGWRLKAQRIHSGVRMWDSSGVLLGPWEGDLDVAADAEPDGNHGMFVAWDGNIQHLDSNGVALWQAGGLPIVGGTLSATRPYVSMGSDGNLLVATYTASNADDSAGVVVNKFTPDGNKLWGSDGIRLDWRVNGDRTPSIVGTADEGAFVVYSRRGNTTTPSVLVCQFLDSNGESGTSYDVGTISTRIHDPVEVSSYQYVVVWTRNRDIFATSVDTTGVTRAFISVPPESLIVKSPVTGKFLKPAKRKKHQFPNWANLLSETVVHGGFQPGATESDFAGGMRVGNSYMVQLISDSLNQKWKPNKDSALVHSWARLTAWNFRKNKGKSAEAIQKTLDSKGSLHNGVPRGFDSMGVPGQLSPKRKPLRGELKTLDPRKTPNQLFAELVALKLGIAASQLGKTPRGFGELVYDVEGSPFDEMQLVEISSFADSVMTHWEGVPQIVFDSLYSAMYTVNRIFAGPLDTITFERGGTLSIRGAVQLNSIPFIKDLSTAPRGLMPTYIGDDDEEAEFEDEEWESAEVPMVARLYQNYPNPFNPMTTLGFRLREASLVSVKVFDLLGREIGTLAQEEEFEEGYQTIEFAADGLASGVYFYRVEIQTMNAGERFNEARKMLLIR